MDNPFQLTFDYENYRRVIGGMDVILHCHHYNARIIHIIQSSKHINGKEILVSSAEEVFSEYIKKFFKETDTVEDKWLLVKFLYRHLGFGLLDISKINSGVVTASTSHIVEGCDAGYQEINYPVCNFTEGYLQGAYHAVTGESVYFTEKTCLKLKEPECTFILDKNRNDPIFFHKRFKKRIEMKRENKYQISNIDEDLIVHTVSQMPLFGNEDGLIPAFNVYLANMPVDFYNLICLRFLEDMEKKKLLSTAQNLLVIAGEICAINTLRGFMNSREWKSLVEPMIKEESDNIFGLVALTNSLGWGNWHICEHEIEEKLIIESLNSYEATGFLKYKNEASISQCYTLRGVATGMMELLYTDGSVEERIGSYDSEEYSCVAAGNYSCKFKVMPI